MRYVFGNLSTFLTIRFGYFGVRSHHPQTGVAPKITHNQPKAPTKKIKNKFFNISCSFIDFLKIHKLFCSNIPNDCLDRVGGGGQIFLDLIINPGIISVCPPYNSCTSAPLHLCPPAPLPRPDALLTNKVHARDRLGY